MISVPNIPKPPKPLKPRKPRIPFKRKYPRRRPLTCIVGLKSKDGVVLVSDRRVTTDLDVRDKQKIFLVFNKFAIAGSGHTFLIDYFIEDMNKIENVKNFSEMVIKLEDVTSKLHRRYSKRLKMEGFYFPLQALLIGLSEHTSGQPRMRHFEGNGVSEEVDDFQVIGSGAPYALPFVKIIYDEKYSINQLSRIGYYAISTIINLELGTGVGGEPDVIILKKDGVPRFLEDEDLMEGGYLPDAHWSDWLNMNKAIISKIALQTSDMGVLQRSYFSEEEPFRELVEKTLKKRRAEY